MPATVSRWPPKLDRDDLERIRDQNTRGVPVEKPRQWAGRLQRHRYALVLRLENCKDIKDRADTFDLRE